MKKSVIALFLCYAVMIYTAFFFHPKWNETRTEATLSWDVSGYYMYLPAIFIYKDIKHCGFKDSILTKYMPTTNFQQAFIHEKSGNYVMKYSSGQAIAMSPFFFLAHAYCKWNPTYPADGFSFPYQLFIGVGMFLYALIGLFLLRKVLLKFFEDTTVSILLLCYVVGSNYLNYTAIDQAMTHNMLFMLYCLLIYNTIKFYENPTFKIALVIGVIIGFATLIRPTEIISVLIPVCWNMDSYKEVISKYHFVKIHILKFILMSIAVLLVFSIQLMYWKYAANEWFVYSYEDQGFNWLHPHIYDFSLSYRCGWLRYSPMMILPLVGIFYYIRAGKNKLAILAFIFINSYIVMAWDIWDYGSSSGRAMIQSYPILAFPFCLFIEQMTKKRWLTILLFIPILLFAYLNIWWTYHSHAGNIQTFDITKEYYRKLIGRWNGTDEDRKLLDNPHVYYKTPKNAQILYSNDFSNDTSLNATKDPANNQIRINKELQSTAEYFIAKTPNFKKWIRVSATFSCPLKEWDVWKQAQFVLQFLEHEKVVQSNFIRIHRFITNGETKKIYIDAIIPNATWGKLKISFWNADGDKELYIDNLELISFEEE